MINGRDSFPRDLRGSHCFREIEERFREWYRPGQNIIADIDDAMAAPDGRLCAATGTVCDDLVGSPATRIVELDLETGAISVLTQGPNSDCAPRWSPDGKRIAFISDRERAGIFRLYILDRASGQEVLVAGVEGLVEYHQWSPDGRYLLAGVAGLGADLPGALGGVSIMGESQGLPDWMPEIEVGSLDTAWRAIWLYDLAEKTARKISPDGANVWEAVWCGPSGIAAICSDSPDEASWYEADIRWFSNDGKEARLLYKPTNQLGWISASPVGTAVAVVEAICSDRLIVAGELRIIDVGGNGVDLPNTNGADVTAVTWRGDHHLLLTALSGFDNLVLLHDRRVNSSTILWQGREQTPAGDRFPKVFPLGEQPTDYLFIREGWFDRPTLIAVQGGKQRDIITFGSDTVDRRIAALGSAEPMTWQARDGLDIHGWLLKPPGDGPHPVVMNIHGGPIWMYRPHYLGRHFLPQSLLAAGYAVFEPNARGSSGRGQAFARHVLHDMGGADAQDLLTGLDHLVAKGIADPARLGVTGGSYGGFMTSWLITQDQRFAAAVPLAPVTDWVSEHLTSHIPRFCDLFLEGTLESATGQHLSRSPIRYAHKVKTPTLLICGARDKNTPPGQAIEFHHALLRNGVTAALATYPLEGHGIRQMPAIFDYLARVLGWFEHFMPASVPGRKRPA